MPWQNPGEERWIGELHLGRVEVLGKVGEDSCLQRFQPCVVYNYHFDRVLWHLCLASLRKCMLDFRWVWYKFVHGHFRSGM